MPNLTTTEDCIETLRWTGERFNLSSVTYFHLIYSYKSKNNEEIMRVTNEKFREQECGSPTILNSISRQLKNPKSEASDFFCQKRTSHLCEKEKEFFSNEKLP